MPTFALTVIGGVCIFAISQFVLHIWIEPILEQRRVVGRIANALSYFPSSPQSRLTERGNVEQPKPAELRQMAADLVVTLKTIPGYRFFETIKLVLPKEKVQRASLYLLGWRTGAESANLNEAASARIVNEFANELRTVLNIENWLQTFTDKELLASAGIILGLSESKDA